MRIRRGRHKGREREKGEREGDRGERESLRWNERERKGETAEKAHTQTW